MHMEEGPYIPHYFGDRVKDLYRGHLGWLTCAVHHSIPWPAKDVLVRYDDEDYFLRGLREDGDKLNPACITVRLSSQSDINKSLRKIYKFTSILGWFKRGYVEVIGYISGSHPMRYGAANQPFIPVMASGPYGFNCNFMPLIKDEKTRRTLAFWREGLRLEHVHAGYSFLSFYKVMESQFKGTKGIVNWINSAICTLTGEAGDRIAKLREDNIDIGDHLYQRGRCAVAHASLGRKLVDPDIPEDRIRIEQDLVVVCALANKFIRDELGVPDEMDVHKNRDALRPVYEYLGQADVSMLHNGGCVPIENLGINGVKVSVNQWPHKALEPLKNLSVYVVSTENGLVDIRTLNDAKTLSLSFLLSFTKRKAGTNLDKSGVLPTERGGAPENEIAFLEYQKAVIGNGIIEVLFPNGQKLVCEIVIPVNVDIGKTFRAIDQRIQHIRQYNARPDSVSNKVNHNGV